MATLASGGSVFPSQRIFRIVVVLKKEHFPIPLGVTALTLRGKLSFMLVVLLVAGVAVARGLVFV